MKQPGYSFESQSSKPEVITNPSGETIALRFDAVPILEQVMGSDWQEQATGIIESGSFSLRSADGHYTNREKGNSSQFGLVTADGLDIVNTTPGIWQLYQDSFRDMMQQVLPEDSEPFRTYDDPSKAIEGYSQQPVEPSTPDEIEFRLEAHIDLRYTAVLVIEAPEDDNDGGRLVISNDASAESVDEINQDATYIKHIPGTLVCFVEGRKYPHYTEEMTNPESKRTVISLNYPAETETEDAAEELMQHIKGSIA